MKKILLVASLLLGTVGLHAQSKATASVTLVTGMTAKIELNSTTDIATLTFSGPSDRWFALQIGSFNNGAGMEAGTDVVYYNGTTLIDAVQNGMGALPLTDTNDWTVTSNTVSGNIRTIVATRAFDTASEDDYVFLYDEANVDFAWAKAASATYNFTTHGGNRGYSLNNAYTCIAPAAPTGEAVQQFSAGDTVSDFEFTVEEGAAIQWYIQGFNGLMPIEADTEPEDGLQYYVTQTIDGCESQALIITADEVLNAGAFSLQELKVYPNPVNDVLNVSYKSGVSEVMIVTMLGQEVVSRQVNAETAVINTANLPGGTYIVKVITQKGTAAIKIVK